MQKTTLWLLVALAAAGLGVSQTARSQAWPAKPVLLIVPFPPGGGTDAFARPLTAKLSQQLGEQVIIENMGGAGGTVGAAAAAKRAPDGYTWFMGAVHHTIAESYYPKLSYSLERDFDPITPVAVVPNVVVVHPKHNFKSLQELIEYLRANPGKLNYGSAGGGTTHHLAGELFKSLTKTFIVHIPYSGAGPMMRDLLAGQVDLAFDGMGSSAPQIRAGKLRALGVTTAQRNSAFPDVPTLQQAGVAGYEAQTWYAIWAPKGVPREIRERMHRELTTALNQADLKRIWAEQGADPGLRSADEFAALIRAEIAKWAKVVKDSGAKADG